LWRSLDEINVLLELGVELLLGSHICLFFLPPMAG
jgi:hypothetical protein